jgi:hypothetical protein
MFEELPPIHGRHIDVQEDEVGPWIFVGSFSPATLEIVKGFLAAARNPDMTGTAGLFQRHLVQKIGRFIVVDKKDTIQLGAHGAVGPGKSINSPPEMQDSLSINRIRLGNSLNLNV